MNFSAEHLSKSYQGRLILADVSVSLKTGERLCVMGPSGCGKTTLCRILAGLERADGGSLQGFGAVRLSMVFQEDRLAGHLSAVENTMLALGGRDAKRTAAAALERLGLAGEERNKPVRQLSGGQRRRVALARAMLAPGELLILDEPFRGLDRQTRSLATSFVLEQQGERPLLYVTHEEAETEALGGGRLALPAPPAEDFIHSHER